MQLLRAALTDFPLVVRNLYPDLNPQAQREKIAAFEAAPAAEMLKILQYLRNLVHPPRCIRIGVKFGAGEFESDCKFVFVIAIQVMACLFDSFRKKAETRLTDVEGLVRNLSPEDRAGLITYIRGLVQDASTSIVSS